MALSAFAWGALLAAAACAAAAVYLLVRLRRVLPAPAAAPDAAPAPKEE